MKILLINPNQYRTPPVPPLALEHLYSVLRGSPHECRILDLCFSDDPISLLDEEINNFTPHVAGFTIRNIDSCIYRNNIFFLDDIKKLIDYVKRQGIPVLLGGSGFSFIPEGIIEYLGADWGIKGPGEKALRYFLDLFEKNPPRSGTIFDGWEIGFDQDFRVYRNDFIDYEGYVNERGILGFETQKGCKEQCLYCLEGNSRLLFRNHDCVVDELKYFANRGFTSFHLCDTEFNQDLEHCKNFLETLINKGPAITWTLYMKSAPYDDELFKLLKKSGANMITLSLPTGENWLEHARKQCSIAKKHDLKLAVDLLVGLPGETIESVKRTISVLREIQPDTVGVNSTIRLFPEQSVAKKIAKSAEYQKHLLGAVDNNPHLIRPVFYQHLSADKLREIIGDDPLFKIEGFERTSNYERL